MSRTSSSDEWMKEIPLPELGEGVTSGELVKWQVSKGDNVHTDQVLAEIMTDKAAMEVSSPYDGKVENLLVQEGDTVEVGHALLMLKISDRVAPVKEDKVESVSTALSPPQKFPDVPSQKDISRGSKSVSRDQNSFDELSSLRQDNVLATPLTRRLAQKLGIDLKTVKGSGLVGRITKEDLEKHSSLAIPKASLASPYDVSKSSSTVSGIFGIYPRLFYS